MANVERERQLNILFLLFMVFGLGIICEVLIERCYRWETVNGEIICRADTKEGWKWHKLGEKVTPKTILEKQ